MSKTYFSLKPYLASDFTELRSDISDELDMQNFSDNWQLKAQRLQARRWRELNKRTDDSRKHRNNFFHKLGHA